jgi:hypothetical protein
MIKELDKTGRTPRPKSIFASVGRGSMALPRVVDEADESQSKLPKQTTVAQMTLASEHTPSKGNWAIDKAYASWQVIVL